MARSTFPIIAIGASAGGIEALSALFKRLPPHLNAAIVIITHLAPNRDSMLPEIIRRLTKIPVNVACQDQMIAPGHISILPPDTILTVRDGKLELTPRGNEYNPIDIFLTSLAKDMGGRGIAVILSGTGNDGSVGTRAVREAGGLTLAQTGDSAHTLHHPDMPEAAIATGFVDCILPIDELADHLTRYVEVFPDRPLALSSGLRGASTAEIEAAKATLYAALQFRVGHDFSRYKDKTFLRRVERRMQVLQMTSLDNYLELIKQEPAEVSALFRDLLIGVTDFFRDEETFAGLTRLVIPQLLAAKGAADCVRVWVPGCATGEEAYSIAMLLCAATSGGQTRPRIQIFATDVDERALAIARAGRYPERLLDSVPPEQARRFFVREGANFVVSKEIRELCLFSLHSLIRDPPFSQIDLISCRNLLIYMNTELQNQVIPIFHYALRQGGYLFLGA